VSTRANINFALVSVIIGLALEGDAAGVRTYSEVLVRELRKAGDEEGARRIEQKLEGHIHSTERLVVLDQLDDPDDPDAF
jgi:hypothetical protein